MAPRKAGEHLLAKRQSFEAPAYESWGVYSGLEHLSAYIGRDAGACVRMCACAHAHARVPTRAPAKTSLTCVCLLQGCRALGARAWRARLRASAT